MDIERVIEETREERWLLCPEKEEITNYFSGYLNQGQIREIISCLLSSLKRDHQILLMIDNLHEVFSELFPIISSRTFVLKIKLSEDNLSFIVHFNIHDEQYYRTIESVLALFKGFFIYLVIKSYFSTRFNFVPIHNANAIASYQIGEQIMIQPEYFDYLRNLNKTLATIVAEYLGLNLATIVKSYFLDPDEIEKQQLLERLFPYPASEIISQY